MAAILAITPNPLLDFLATGTVTLGKVSRVTAFTPVAGGKGINMARVLARHGHRVIATGFSGSGQGDVLTRLVDDDGIEAAFIPVAAPARIGFQVIDAARSRTTAVLESGFPVNTSENTALLRRLRDLLPSLDLVLVGGSVPCPACTALLRQICDACHRAGKPCWIDAYGPAMDEALAGPHPPLLAKPNRQEYGDGKAWLTCSELHLTDGAAAIRVRTPQGSFRVTAPRIREVNPVGSGDSYIAALAHARLSGWTLPDQLAYAAAAGAANAMRADVARIGPDDIRPLAGKVTVEARRRP
jgi:tagatose 6-phosphate kinase